MANKTVYRCKKGVACAVKGTRYHFGAGDLVLDDHPVKPKNNPYFEEVSEYVERISQPRSRGVVVVVEQATAEPGEKRRLGGLLGPKVKDATAGESPTQESRSGRPPTSGTGSGVEAWRSYAATVTDTPAESWASLSRAEIIDLLDSEGVTSDEGTPVEPVENVAPEAQEEQVPDGQE